ncbi:LysM peptidoglycan-binding domain-containing protein [Streptacidiphilus sp. 4-A2]|nr:LysM peptidoglycan-binding domain-containing protein [Streptacidiphilus sp. 4-A2]
MERHTVRPGETLSAIAEQSEVPGGWQSLYAQNRVVVGADPDLIRPGEQLSWTADSIPGARAGPGLRSAHIRPQHHPSHHADQHRARRSATAAAACNCPCRSVPRSVRPRPGPWSSPAGAAVTATWWRSAMRTAPTAVTGTCPGSTSGPGRASARAPRSDAGATGSVTGPSLHFAVEQPARRDTAADPLAWLADRGVTLA